MGDVRKFDVEEFPYYQGPGFVHGIKFRQAAKALGITAWGMNVLEIESGCTAYPEHDHVKDGQEEVYVVLRGTCTLLAGGQDWKLKTGSFVRVGPGEKRKIVPGTDGVTVLAIGATPGKAYEPRR